MLQSDDARKRKAGHLPTARARNDEPSYNEKMRPRRRKRMLWRSNPADGPRAGLRAREPERRPVISAAAVGPPFIVKSVPWLATARATATVTMLLRIGQTVGGEREPGWPMSARGAGVMCTTSMSHHVPHLLRLPLLW
jgi:hypothetical protein